MQYSRYYYALPGLPPELADEIDNVLAALLPPNAYGYLKATILARTSCLHQLRNAEELRDRRQTQLLHGCVSCSVCDLLKPTT